MASIPNEYLPFISSGEVALLNSERAGDSSTRSGAGTCECTFTYCSIHLKFDLVTDPVTVGVRLSLPVQGVSIILANDLAASK